MVGSKRYSQFVYWASFGQSVLRRNERKGFYVISYPKSGSNWMCNLLSTYFEIPVLEPWLERFPVLSRRIYHLHRLPPFRSIDPRTVYMVRDARDVLISYFFAIMRTPHADKIRNSWFRFVGRTVSEGDLPDVLEQFIEFIHGNRTSTVDYEKHVRQGIAREFVVVRFEDLRSDPCNELAKVIARLNDDVVDAQRVRSAIDENTYEKKRSKENAHFMRAGKSGTWKTYFRRPSAHTFWRYYGETMIRLSYEQSAEWIYELPA